MIQPSSVSEEKKERQFWSTVLIPRLTRKLCNLSLQPVQPKNKMSFVSSLIEVKSGGGGECICFLSFCLI